MAKATKAVINSEARLAGGEPQPCVLMSNEQYIKVLNWYNYRHSNTDAIDFLLKYMESNGYSREDVRALKSVPEWSIQFNLMTRARMLTRGFIFFEDDVDRFKAQLHETILKAKAKLAAKDQNKVVRLPKVSRQEVENWKIGTIEEVLDEFLEYGNHHFKAYDYFRAENVKPQLVKAYAEKLRAIVEELSDPALQRDLVKPLPEKLRKAYIKFIQGIIADAESYTTTKRVEKVVERKPRKIKEKSADQLTRGMKYMRESAEFKIVSQPPSAIIGAQQVWVFNTKYRDLLVYTAATEKGLSAKGVRIIDYDDPNSGLKKVRKPETVLGEITRGTKAGVKRIYTGINATERKGNGRIDENTIILKVFK